MTDPRDTPEDMARRKRETAPNDPEANRKRVHPMQLRVDTDELESFKRAAAASGLDMATWARIVMRRAAGMLTP